MFIINPPEFDKRLFPDYDYVATMTRIVRTFIFLDFGFICGSRFTIAADDGVTHVGRKPIPAPEMIAKRPPDGGPDFNRLVFERVLIFSSMQATPWTGILGGKKPCRC